MTKTEALQFLQAQIGEIPYLPPAGRDSPTFRKWRRDTSILVGRVFAADQKTLQEFEQVTHDLGLSTTDADDYQAFAAGLEHAGAVLESMVTEIERFWPDEGACPRWT